MKRILICSDGVDSPNKGDQAILVSMLADIKMVFPDLKIETISRSAVRTPIAVFRFICAVMRNDILVMGGGHPFQDLTSQCFLLVSLLEIIVAKICCRPVFCYAIGAGPIVSSLGKFLMPKVLNLADVICVRDRSSAELLASLGVKKEKLVLSADPAFRLEPAPEVRIEQIFLSENIDRSKPIVAFCPRRWFCFHGQFFPQKPDSSEIENNVRAQTLTRHLTDVLNGFLKQHDVNLLFVMTRRAGNEEVCGQDDDIYAKQLKELLKDKFRIQILQGDYTPAELKGILGRCAMVVSVRMHAIIFAAAMGVPPVGIAISKAKGQGIFEKLAQPNCYIPIEDVNSDRLLNLANAVFEKREEISLKLRARMKELSQEPLINIEQLKKFVSGI